VGCGTGTGSERERISSVVRRFLVAFANGDGSAMCQLVSEHQRQRFSGEEVPGAPRAGGLPSCPERVRLLRAALLREFRAAGRKGDPLAELRKAKVAVVSLTDLNAVARVTFPAGYVSDIPLAKTASAWVISGEGRCVPTASAGCHPLR
jgi:hypothetical protein